MCIIINPSEIGDMFTNLANRNSAHKTTIFLYISYGFCCSNHPFPLVSTLAPGIVVDPHSEFRLHPGTVGPCFFFETQWQNGDWTNQNMDLPHICIV